MAETEVRTEPEQTIPRVELEQADEYSRYLLYSRAEILSVLRTVIKKGALITVHFDHGQSFLLTAMLALTPDSDGMILDIGSDEEMNQKALQAKRLILTALVDKVKIQFRLEALSTIEYEGRPAFIGRIPEALLRLQRREFFRLSTPIAAPVFMMTTIRQPDGSAMSAEIPLFDISGGGVGLMVEPALAEFFEQGSTIGECRINLPDEGLLVASLFIRNKFDVTSRTGYHFVRIGCEFVDTAASRLTMVQRYITRVERERKARLSGLA